MEKLLFYDIETTGVNFWQHGIHQLSGNIQIDGKFEGDFNIQMQPNPAAKIEDKALEVGGVTREILATYIPMKDAYNKFMELITPHCDKFNKTDKFHLVGYNNAAFDNQFLRAWFVQNAATPKDAEYGNYFGSWFWSSSIDVMVLAANKLKSIRHEMADFKLKTVAKQLGIEVDESQLHNAMYDIHLTESIYNIVK
jgi:DNA polymerase-3 subunit epsilon